MAPNPSPDIPEGPLPAYSTAEKPSDGLFLPASKMTPSYQEEIKKS
jgi:hypothetical protein